MKFKIIARINDVSIVKTAFDEHCQEFYFECAVGDKRSLSVLSGWSKTSAGLTESIIVALHDHLNEFNARVFEREKTALQSRIDELERRLADAENTAVRDAQERLDDAKYNAHIRSIGSDFYYTNGKSEEDARRISGLTSALVAAKKNAQVAE